MVPCGGRTFQRILKYERRWDDENYPIDITISGADARNRGDSGRGVWIDTTSGVLGAMKKIVAILEIITFIALIVTISTCVATNCFTEYL